MKKSFRTFFEKATGHDAPYNYQQRLACGEHQGVPCVSRLIDVPTGLGKTAAVVMAWLWNRVILDCEDWPRRLVYCLPMRTLVEQTRGKVQDWIVNLCQAADELELSQNARSELTWLREHSPVVLMGGEERNQSKSEWDIYPEKPAVLIGTQDMLLSRALNRGYGMSRFRWPMHFALLNNDCLWILDETQLMGSGVETSAQLTAFRSRFSTVGRCATWWMSATLDFNCLKTVDYSFEAADGNKNVLRLAAEEREHRSVTGRFKAPKKIAQVPDLLLKNSDSKKDVDAYSEKLASWIWKKHLKKHCLNTLTLVILNRVNRAQKVFHQIEKAKANDSSAESPDLALIHSRFRSQDRKKYERKLENSKASPTNLICVATQAVEAGMDLDADLLVTELAPWSSLVQRFGRCNRHGLRKDSRIFWINLRDDKAAAPYSLQELDASRCDLAKLEGKDANPNTLDSIKIEEQTAIRPVIRWKDVLDLFDTTPDLAGNDLDVSRYIRDGQDNDVNVFWREFEEGEAVNQPKPTREEFCSVAISQLQKFLKKAKESKAYAWDVLDGKWKEAEAVIPGGVYMLSAGDGGYSTQLGWTGDSKDKVTCCPPSDLLADAPESTDENSTSFLGVPAVTLEQHTNNVARETSRLVQALSLVQWESVFSQVAQWHDVGKAHPDFQAMLREGIDEATAPKELLLAKSGTNKKSRCKRKYFRHELLSALAWLHKNSDKSNGESINLIAYLIASHHGKVRLSIRSLPKEKPPAEFKDRRIARGVVEGERMPAIRLGCIDLPESTIDLSLMEMGTQSWLSRMLALRDDLGPFRLAFLESVFRAADMTASQSEKREANQNDKS